MKQTRVYDWNGVLITVDGFWAYLQEHRPDLFRAYKIEGDKDPERKRAVRPEFLRVYKHATNEGLYPVELFPHVQERLAQDAADGYRRTVFTSAPRSTVQRQLATLGVAGLVDEVVVLDDVVEEFRLPGAMKEDPVLVFEKLAQFLRFHRIGDSASYVDDSKPRISSAVQANSHLGERGLGTIYHFDPKASASPVLGEGYTTINDLLHIG